MEPEFLVAVGQHLQQAERAPGIATNRYFDFHIGFVVKAAGLPESQMTAAAAGDKNGEIVGTLVTASGDAAAQALGALVPPALVQVLAAGQGNGYAPGRSTGTTVPSIKTSAKKRYATLKINQS